MQNCSQPDAPAASFIIYKPLYALNKMVNGPQSGSGYFIKEISVMSFVLAWNRTLGHFVVTPGRERGGWIQCLHIFFFCIKIVFLATERREWGKGLYMH